MKNNLDKIAFGRFVEFHVRKLDGVDDLLAITINDTCAAPDGTVNSPFENELLNQRINIKHI